HRRFMFLSPGGGTVDFYRFDGSDGKGEIAIPCGKLWSVTASGVGRTKLWVDLNGDGVDQPAEESDIPSPFGSAGNLTSSFDVDSNGDIWWINDGIVHLTMQGLNQGGVPLYTLAASGYAALPVPQPFAGIRALKYDNNTDSMYVAGDTPTHTLQSGF